MPGPLSGIRVIELGGIGPGPHAAMVLADFGAEVVRVMRPGDFSNHLTLAWKPRGCSVAELDLKVDTDRQRLIDLVAVADVVIEGFRPGVAERLGIGPADCHQRNPRLVYGRITGWGQTGPYAQAVGHDINYLSLSGLLHAIGTADTPPPPPLSLVGDFGGGSMLLLVGLLASLWERERSGVGQVVDAAMLDGTMLIGDLFIAEHSSGEWSDRRSDNLLDGGAPFYRCYECADGGYMAVGAIEPQFFAELVAVLGISLPVGFNHLDRSNWASLSELLTATFQGRTRDDWERAFANRDACVTPVLTFSEMRSHPQIRDRRLVNDYDGISQGAPAPRFSRTTASRTDAAPGQVDVGEVIRRWSADWSTRQ